MSVNLGYPEEHFSMVEDNLLDRMKEVGNYEKILDNVEKTIYLQ